jgi:hypothetical protein
MLPGCHVENKSLISLYDFCVLFTGERRSKLNEKACVRKYDDDDDEVKYGRIMMEKPY